MFFSSLVGQLLQWAGESKRRGHVSFNGRGWGIHPITENDGGIYYYQMAALSLTQKRQVLKWAQNHTLGAENEALRLSSFSVAITLLTYPHLRGFTEGIDSYLQYEACFKAADCVMELFAFTEPIHSTKEIMGSLLTLLDIASGTTQT